MSVFLRLFAVGLVFWAVPMPAPAEVFGRCFCMTCQIGPFRSLQIMQGGMKPSIETGQCIVAATHRDVVARAVPGTIVVFDHPTMNAIYVFRMVATAGQTVALSDGHLIIDGIEVGRTERSPYHQLFEAEGPLGIEPKCPAPTPPGAVCEISRLTETLPNGAAYDVLDINPNGPGDTFGPVTVPEGHVFVLGDNRDNALDSRFTYEARGAGFVPLENIIGIVSEPVE